MWTTSLRALSLALAVCLAAVVLAGGCSSSQQAAADAGRDHGFEAAGGGGGRTAVHVCPSDAFCSSTMDASRDGGAGGAVASGTSASDAGACVPSAEICDGKDNDCDGVVDNGFKYQGTPVGNICYSSGYGACLAVGRVICTSATAAGCSGTPTSADDTFHTVAAPNGSWDWNCNNNIDRKYPLAACESFTASTCPSQGWKPEPGHAGDCGESLVQQSCTATATGCQSTGQPTAVTEGCK